MVRIAASVIALLLAGCSIAPLYGEDFPGIPNGWNGAARHTLRLPPRITVYIVDAAQTKIKVAESVSGCIPAPKMPLTPSLITVAPGYPATTSGRIAQCLPHEWVYLTAEPIINAFTKCMLQIRYNAVRNEFHYRAINSGYGNPQSACTVHPSSGVRTTLTYNLKGSQ